VTVREADRIEVWQQRPGLWRYMFVAGGDHTEIVSNETYRSLEEALGAASVAYPDVPVAGYQRPRARVWPWILAGLLGVVVLGLMVWLLRRGRNRSRPRRSILGSP
jgi:hypothetical protein